MSWKHDHVCVNAHVHGTSTMSNQKKLDCSQFMQRPSNDMTAQTDIGKISVKNAKEDSLGDTSSSVNSTHSKESEAATLCALTT